MRLAAVTLALALLAGCQTTPPPLVVPKIVYVTVKEVVPVPDELTKPCGEYVIKRQSYGEAIVAANKRKAYGQECSKRMAEIRALGRKP